MKKLAVGILAVLIGITATACGSSTEKATKNENTQTTEMVSEPTDRIRDSEEIAFEELLAIDNDECSIKITGIDPDDIWGYTLKTQLENKSMDKTYMYSVESAALNGVQCTILFATEVAPGKKANKEISFSDDELQDNGVGKYTVIEVTFRVYDSNDWTAEPVAHEKICLYPYGEDEAVTFEREGAASDVTIFDNEYVTMIATNSRMDSIWGFTIDLYLINKTDSEVMFTVDDASVNGFMMDPFFAKSVAAGKSAFASISWYESSLKENGIDDVKEIEAQYRAYDYSDWSADDYANVTATLTMN